MPPPRALARIAKRGPTFLARDGTREARRSSACSKLLIDGLARRASALDVFYLSPCRLPVITSALCSLCRGLKGPLCREKHVGRLRFMPPSAPQAPSWRKRWGFYSFAVDSAIAAATTAAAAAAAQP